MNNGKPINGKHTKREKSFEDLLKEVDDEIAASESSDIFEDDYDEWEENEEAISDDLSVRAIMHRDAHFEGQFEKMFEYYSKGGKGIHPDLDQAFIENLYDIEKHSPESLSQTLLSEGEKAKVLHVLEIYEKLRKTQESTTPQDKHLKLIADLILSEEEYPEAIINEIVAEKESIVPMLIELLQNEHFHDPLFPGYGLAPQLAALCLGMIGGKRAIMALFESIGHENFFNEEVSIEALCRIGEPAKDFLLQVLKGKTITHDTEKAALALDHFIDDPEIAKAGFELLKRKEAQNNLPLCTYLILMCEDLKDKKLREEFIELSKNKALVPLLRRDMEAVIKSWE